MNQSQWETIKNCALMKTSANIPVALIIDSPWIPGYTGLPLWII